MRRRQSAPPARVTASQQFGPGVSPPREMGTPLTFRLRGRAGGVFYCATSKRTKPMLVEMRLTSEIKLYPGNPRVNDAAVAAVAASIREFGFRQPIVVDEEGVIVVGHTRYKAALKLGMEAVRVHVAVGLSKVQLTAYRLADNQTA